MEKGVKIELNPLPMVVLNQIAHLLICKDMSIKSIRYCNHLNFSVFSI